MREEIEKLVDLLEGDPPPEACRLALLAVRLDELMAAYHRLPDGSPAEDYPEPPERDFKAVYAASAARFPELGMYPCADPSEETHVAELMVGDAVDDLADIVGDLKEAQWRWANVGESDARWCLHLYFFHWGRHLRDLQLYLHANYYDRLGRAFGGLDTAH